MVPTRRFELWNVYESSYSPGYDLRLSWTAALTEITADVVTTYPWWQRDVMTFSTWCFQVGSDISNAKWEFCVCSQYISTCTTFTFLILSIQRNNLLQRTTKTIIWFSVLFLHVIIFWFKNRVVYEKREGTRWLQSCRRSETHSWTECEERWKRFPVSNLSQASLLLRDVKLTSTFTNMKTIYALIITLQAIN